jgi:hypothetical protein
MKTQLLFACFFSIAIEASAGNWLAWRYDGSGISP